MLFNKYKKISSTFSLAETFKILTKYADILSESENTNEKTKIKNNTTGMNCKKCNTLNEYITTSNQPNGSYLCYGCRSGF